MLKFLIGDTNQMIGLVLQPLDLIHLRAKPLDNLVQFQGAQFARPDFRILITYARSGTQARKWIKARAKGGTPIPGAGPGCITFSGQSLGQTLVGVMLTEPEVRRFEAEPLTHHQIFDDPRYGLPNFRLMLTYSDSDRALVYFLRELGVSQTQLSQDPNLAALWDSYRQESVDALMRMAKATGHDIPIENAEIAFKDKPESSGMSTDAILATRGQDMAWFKQHPGENQYYRRAVPGEFPPEINAEWVKVINLPESAPRGASARMKMPMNRVGGEFVEAKSKKPT